MPAHVDPQYPEPGLQQCRHLLGPAAAVGGQRMGDAYGRRRVRADEVIGDRAPVQWQKHRGPPQDGVAVYILSLGARDALTRAVSIAGSPAMLMILLRLLAPATIDRSRRGRRHCFASRRSRASLAWFSAGGAVTTTLSILATIPSIRSAPARGVNRTAMRMPPAVTLRGDSEQDGS